MKFKDKNILVIGGDSDIAKSLIDDLIKLESNIFFTSRNYKKVKSLQQRTINDFGIASKGYVLDITNFNSHELFWDNLEVTPDIVITCIGYMGKVDISGSDNTDLVNIVNINYLGLICLLNIISNDFKARKSGGVIVGISSVAGERGRKSNFIYGSAKSGFTAYLSGLRNKLYMKNVHIITILPGPVKTKMTKDLKISKYLSSSPQVVSSYIIDGIKHRKNVVYVKWYWKFLMLIIKVIPESIFKKLNL